jgi:hypothetical protein
MKPLNTNKGHGKKVPYEGKRVFQDMRAKPEIMSISSTSRMLLRQETKR